MGAQRLGDLVAYRPDRIERTERVLIDQPDLAAAHAPELGIRAIEQLALLEADRARRDGGRGLQAGDRHAGQRLSRAGFADDHEGLALAHVEGVLVDGGEVAAAPRCEGIADQREGGGREHDHRSGKHEIPPGRAEIRAGVADQQAPFGRRRIRAEAEEGEGGDGDERIADIGGDAHIHLLRDEGQDVAAEDREVRDAERARGLDMRTLAQPQHLAAHQPRIAWPPDDGERQRDAAETAADRGGHGERQHESGKAEEQVDDAHHHIVGRSARHAGDGAIDDAEQR